MTGFSERRIKKRGFNERGINERGIKRLGSTNAGSTNVGSIDTKPYDTNDVNIACNSFITMLSSAFETAFPLKRISRTEFNDKLWLTPALKKSILHKEELFHKWKKHNTINNRLKYINYKRSLIKLINKAKINFYKDTFNLTMNKSKNVWSKLNTHFNLG